VTVGTRVADSAAAVEPAPPRRQLEALLGVPFTTGNTLQVLRNGVEVFPAMLDAIAGSTRSVDLLWFLWGRGEVTERIADALAERAAAGVRVRVLLDGFGAKGSAPAQLARMRDAGCDVVFFRPVRGWRLTTANLRTHRRVLVCDETVGFTGGTGIDSAWTGAGDRPSAWRDNAYRITGPAVDGLRAAFAQDWLQSPRPVSDHADAFPAHDTSGSSSVQVIRAISQPGWNESALAVLALLDLAQHRVRATTPYLRLPERWHEALAAAVRRGVQVQLLVPGPHVDRPFVAAQSRHGHGRLLDAGVELWQYQPTMMHAKVVTVDGSLALVGTTNLDHRSFDINEQLALVVDDDEVTSLLDAHFDEDLESSVGLSPSRWHDRGRRERLVEAAADLVGRPLSGLGSRGLTGRRA
jgi:cardiolipin synthase